MTEWTLNGKIQSWEQMLESRSGVFPNPATQLALLWRLIKGMEGVSVLTTFFSTVPMSWMIFIYTMSCFVQCWSQLCLPTDSLKSSFSWESPWNIRAGISQQMCIWELPTLQLRRHVLCFSSLWLLKCLSNASLLKTQWVQNNVMGTQRRKTRVTQETTTQSQAIAENLDLISSWWLNCLTSSTVDIASQALAPCAKEASKGAGTPVVFNRLFPVWALKVAIIRLELASWGVTGVLIVDAVCFVYNFLLDKLHVSTDA